MSAGLDMAYAALELVIHPRRVVDGAVGAAGFAKLHRDVAETHQVLASPVAQRSDPAAQAALREPSRTVRGHPWTRPPKPCGPTARAPR